MSTGTDGVVGTTRTQPQPRDDGEYGCSSRRIATPVSMCTVNYAVHAGHAARTGLGGTCCCRMTLQAHCIARSQGALVSTFSVNAATLLVTVALCVEMGPHTGCGRCFLQQPVQRIPVTSMPKLTLPSVTCKATCTPS
jgi:hypothetical protein